MVSQHRHQDAAPADPPRQWRSNLSIARGVVADLTSHSDQDIRAACEFIIEDSDDHAERVRTVKLLEVIRE